MPTEPKRKSGLWKRVKSLHFRRGSRDIGDEADAVDSADTLTAAADSESSSYSPGPSNRASIANTNTDSAPAVVIDPEPGFAETLPAEFVQPITTSTEPQAVKSTSQIPTKETATTISVPTNLNSASNVEPPKASGDTEKLQVGTSEEQSASQPPKIPIAPPRQLFSEPPKPETPNRATMQRQQRVGSPPVMRSPVANGHRATNGYFSPPESPSIARTGGSARGSVRIRSLTSSLHRGGHAGSDKTTIVRDTAITLKRKSASELGQGISETTDKVTFVNLVEWIRSERLATLPHKGSRWDTVLIRALYFAERLNGFESALQGHAVDNKPAAQLGYGHTRLLLELGHENSEALDKAFGFLYRCSSSVTSLLARSQVLSFSSEIYEQLCMMYSDLLTLVIDVAIRFYKAVHSSTEGSVSLDMYQVFGDAITTFRERRDNVTKSIWRDQIITEDLEEEDSVDVNVLARWLAPQDRVLATVAQDHTLIADELAEFTCVWFHDELAKFVKSNEHTLLINGPAGSGKTTLAGSLAERLQRPVSRKTYATLFVSVGAVPSQATTLNVVKGLLYQLLTARVGNMHLYHAITAAYSKARFTADPHKYEELLWHALEDALRNPLDQGQDTILIVEGLDELIDGASAAQGLLQRLVKAVDQGKRVKLIALGQSLSLPAGQTVSGTQRAIERIDTQDDIYEVVMKTLAKSHHFRTKIGREQESIIAKIIETAGGSFLWASLACELIIAEKTSDGFTKATSTIHTQKGSIEELVQKIITSLELTEDSKQVLAWLVHVARPLTHQEIESLFAMNVSSGTRSDRRVDVHRAIHALAPVLSIQEDIVRTRHGLVHSAVRNLFKQGKITLLSVKDQPLDVLLRLLTYAKVTLTEKGEPTLDDSDRSPVDYCFGKHHFLEYVVRYWTWHLQQTSIIVPGKTLEIKASPELQKVFPESTVMPILEWLCWDDQFPGAQEVEYHDLVARVRSKVLSEQHPSVLQSYINTAAYYEMMHNLTQASHYYYLISTIGRNILSVSHPVVVETAVRFLRFTHSSITTTRTEVMTRREQVLILLISAYERQYGLTSEIVVQTREQLAELYISIKEQEKANEVLGIVEETTEDTRDLSGTVGERETGTSWVSVRGRKEGEKLDGLTTVFGEGDDEEDSTTILDLAQVETIFAQIGSYISQKDYTKAELTYVELWQRLSESTRKTLNTEWHAKKIEAVQSYAKFLQTHSRQEEAKSVTVSLWREYEHHELSFSETIVSKLTESARFLKTVGEYSASLAILKHASSYYKNVRKEDSRSVTEIEEEMIVISNEAIKHSSVQEKTTTEETRLDMFHMLISNSSKKVDSTTISLAKQLTTQYVEQKSWSQAVSVIQSTLQRIWSSFMSKSIHEVTLTLEFQKESIEMAEQLAECYVAQRQFEKAEDTYVRLFRASLSASTNQTLLDRVKNTIIGFYSRRGHPDKVISVYQELLAVYRRVHGPHHDTTISVLYQLATLCRAHARSHPYWIEYYQQIVTALNKDSKTCHPRAMEAAIIVAESYWEERRYSDAVSTYALIWQTFVHKTKEFKSFSEETFVRNLYERYYQCLEETKADWEILRAVSSEYRETTHSAFGATSSLSIESTLALARVMQHSEQHSSEAISLYEEASHRMSQSKTVGKSWDSSEITRSLQTLYKKRVFHSDSKSVSQETVEKATNVFLGQYSETKKSYGYSHQSTLSSLRELSQLYVRQQKSELAVKELTTATVEVLTKEESSQRSYEAATSIVQSFQAASLTEQCTKLVEELHYQLIAKEKTSQSTFSVVESKSSALFFLAAMEYHLRKDISITLSEIMASLQAQSILFANYKQTINTKASLDKILIAAAPLRQHLKTWNRNNLIANVDSYAIKLFIEREAANVQLLSKDASARHFIIGILDYLGTRRNVDFVRAVIISANRTLANLIETMRFKEAHDVAKMAFKYAQYRKGYKGPNAIARGFTLASYLDGRGENRCPEPELRQKLLKLSNDIIKDILKICREDKINLASVNLNELNELIALLGEQRDHDTLESLLNELWSTREAQRNWPPEILLNLGRRLVCARYLAGHQIKAIRLCEDIAYNLRRVNGIKSPATLEMYELLAQLHTKTGQHYQTEASSDKSAGNQAADHFKKAVLIHEDVLRWLLHDSSGGEVGDDDDDDAASVILAEHGVKTEQDNPQNALDDAKRGELVKRHLHLLKLSYQRLGSWPKNYGAYERLNADLFKTFPQQLKGVEGVEKWQNKGFGAGKAESNDGVFAGNTHWEILR